MILFDLQKKKKKMIKLTRKGCYINLSNRFSENPINCFWSCLFFIIVFECYRTVGIRNWVWKFETFKLLLWFYVYYMNQAAKLDFHLHLNDLNLLFQLKHCYQMKTRWTKILIKFKVNVLIIFEHKFLRIFGKTNFVCCWAWFKINKKNLYSGDLIGMHFRSNDVG